MKTFLTTLFPLWLLAYESATGLDAAYRGACLRAATDPLYFQIFRKEADYAHAVELGRNDAFAIYLLEQGCLTTLEKLDTLQKLDEIGSPSRFDFPDVGFFSGTTLRYIVVADQITGLFSLPNAPKIAEIGAGFGGQCFIIKEFFPDSRYWIYDLPEVEWLIEKVLETLCVDRAFCLDISAPFPEEKIDLLISNYAFSECDREIQLDYFERVVKKADRGYFLYNRAKENGGIDALSPEEFVQLLEEHGMNPTLYSEPICTYGGNVLIVWDRS